MRRALLVLGALAALPQAGARAQTAAQLLEQGISAYQNFELDIAAVLIRRALAFPASSALPGSEQTRALSFLAAAELFRNRQDSAVAVFERLVLMAPRYRPSDLIFPPAVLNAYHQVRQATKVVEITAPDSLDIPLGSGVFAPRLYASSLHDVAASLVQRDGKLVRSLYRGPISDSLTVTWDGRDSIGTAVSPGSYQFRVESLDRNREVVRIAQLPLDVEIARRDTVPHPPRPDSLLKPERKPFGPALRVLATGVALGGLTAALPAMLEANSHASGTRFILGGALSLAGISAFISRKPGRPIPENVTANAAVRAEWERARQDAIAENRRRREDVRLRVRAGASVQPDRSAR